MSKLPSGIRTTFKKMIAGICVAILFACILYSIFLLPYSSANSDILVGCIIGIAVWALKAIGIDHEE